MSPEGPAAPHIGGLTPEGAAHTCTAPWRALGKLQGRNDASLPALCLSRFTE